MDKISASLALMRRLPPNKIEQNLTGLLNLLPEETDELLQRIDQPLKSAVDKENGRPYLLCDYNRDGDSHRSPWSNKYEPALEDGFLPSEKLRSMEVEFNELFDAYRELYYEGGVSSVYLWDLDQGFAGCFLIKKNVESDRYVKQGGWDSIHIVEVTETDSKSAQYKLTTSIMLTMSVEKAEVGSTNWSGTLTRQTEMASALNETKTHYSNIGRMIEDMEIEMRSNLNELYILKTREIVNSIRANRVNGPQQSAMHIASLNAAVLGHGKNRTIDSEN